MSDDPRCEARLTASLQCVHPDGHEGNHRYVDPAWFTASGPLEAEPPPTDTERG